jgi:hypothetical protein
MNNTEKLLDETIEILKINWRKLNNQKNIWKN